MNTKPGYHILEKDGNLQAANSDDQQLVVTRKAAVDAFSPPGRLHSKEYVQPDQKQLLALGSPLVTPQMNPRYTATRYSCTLNLMNTMIGAGILTLPYAFSKLGVIMGLTIMVLAASSTLFCLHILSLHVKILRNPSYSKLATLTMPRFKVLVDFAIALMCFGNSIGYLVIIGDNVTDAVRGISSAAKGFLIDRKLWILVDVVCVITPVSMLKNLHSLRHLSTVSIVMTTFITIVICLYAYEPEAYFSNAKMDCPDGSWYISLPPGTGILDVLREIPLFIFGFTCHQNILSLCIEAKTQRQREFNRIIYYGVGGVALIYTLFAMTGFYLIGTALKPDILTCLPKDSPLVLVCRLGISMNVTFSMPLQVHPTRDSLASMIFGKGLRAKDLSPIKYYGLTLGVIACATAIALVVTDIDTVFGLVGAVCGMFICYILPSYFFIKLVDRSRARVRYIISIFMLAFGIVALPLFGVLQFI